MCGIAGFSLSDNVTIDVNACVRLLLAGLAERGEDACGISWRAADGQIHVIKHALAPSQFLTDIPFEIPASVREMFVHVRDHTKGVPSVEGNNHPIVHGNITGIHNGIIQNDDSLFARYGRTRAITGMSVDSEAIFMLLDVLPTPQEAFPQLIGSYATAWFDSRETAGIHLARGRARPLVFGRDDGIVMFASTTNALAFAAGQLGLPLRMHEARTSSLMTLENGEVRDTKRIKVQRFTERPPAEYRVEDPVANAARSLAIMQSFDTPDSRAGDEYDGIDHGAGANRTA